MLAFEAVFVDIVFVADIERRIGKDEISDTGGQRLTPTHANKKGRRYRYYISQSLIKRGRPKASEAACRVPAADLETLVEHRICALLRDEVALIAACALFGFSVGNLITLPSLIVQREFDARSFGVLVSLVTAINQITYAFGPGVVGLLRDASGGYTLPFYACIGVELTAAVLVMIRGRRLSSS